MSGPANCHEAAEREVFAVLTDALGQLQTLVWMTTMLAWRQTEEMCYTVQSYHSGPRPLIIVNGYLAPLETMDTFAIKHVM